MYTPLKNLVSDINGSIGLNFILGLSAVIVSVGSAVDIARLHNANQVLQTSADSAAIHAAIIAQDQQADLTVESAPIFQKNLEGLSNIEVTNYVVLTNEDSIEVRASMNLEPYFSQFFGFHTLKASVTSAASLSSGRSNPACVTTLNETKAPGFLANSGAGILASECELHIHSEANPATIFNNGITHDVAKTCIAGSTIIDNNGTISNIETSCEVQEDPYAGQFPEPESTSCDFSNGNFNGGIVDMMPGTYCGWFNFNNSNATVNFSPGLYVIKNGGWNVNGGNWSGDGVTFYFADTSKIQFNSGVSATLNPPTSGDYEGVLFTETPDLPFSQFIFNDTNGFDMNGLVYLPSRDVIYNSGAHFELRRFEMVVSSIIINGAVLNLGQSEFLAGDTGGFQAPRILQ